MRPISAAVLVLMSVLFGPPAVTACLVLLLAGYYTLRWATDGTISRKKLPDAELRAIMKPLPKPKPLSEQTAKEWGHEIADVNGWNALPGRRNGAITLFLLGRIDVEEMERMLDERLHLSTQTKDQANKPSS